MRQEKQVISKEQADRLLQRYYDGLTSDHEERLLRIFLASDQASDARYREDRAVMGFVVVGRRAGRSVSHNRFRMVWAAAVACVLLVTGGAYALLQHEDTCVAYINGQRCTDREVVMEYMQQTLRIASQRDGAPTVESQLNAVFGAYGEQ